MPKSKSKSKASARVVRAQRPTHSDDVLRFYTNRLDAFRLPDTTTSATAVMRLPLDQTLTVNADGAGIIAFGPSLGSNTAYNTITAGNLAATWSTYPHPLTSTLTNNAQRARMTGHRLTVRYTGPEQTTSGTMYVGCALAYTSNMISSPLSNYTTQMQAFPITAGGVWTFYVPMYSIPDYKPIDGNFMNDSFMGVVFAFTGMPINSNYITVRSERSIEYVPELTSSVLVSCAPEPYDPVAMAEAGILSGTGPEESPTQQVSYANKVGRSVWNMVRGTAAGVVDGARDDLRDLLVQNQMPMLME